MKRNFALILFALAFSAVAHAGPTSSGSGNALVCRNADGSVRSAELLDFYEAHATAETTIDRSVATDFASALEFGLSRLSKTAYAYSSPTRGEHYDARTVSSMILKNIVFVDAAKIHHFGDSLFLAPLPTACGIEQAAAYLDNDTIEINRDLWQIFAPVDQAGLIVHETVYWFERQMGSVRDSRRARQVTAKIFDPQFIIEDVGALSSDPGTRRYVCFAGENVKNGKWLGLTRVTSLKAYYIGGKLVYQFFWVGGEPLLTRTIATPIEVARTESQPSNETKVAFSFSFQPGEQTVEMIVTKFSERTNGMWASIEGQMQGPWPTSIPREKFECNWELDGDAHVDTTQP